MHSSNRGFTLIEMVIVTAVFVIVMMITAQAFMTILKENSKLSKSEESNIEGIVGLEMMRHDLQQAGFGLPYSFLDSSTPPQYTEASVTPASSYNDATAGIPRALVFGNNLAATSHTDIASQTYTILANTDYIAVKATTLGSANPANNTAQKWTYATYSSSQKPPKIWPSNNMTTNDRIIVVKRSFNGTSYTNQLIYDTSSPATYWTTYNAGGLTGVFKPTLAPERYFLYGIAQSNLGMPFNRSDFFVAKPSTSAKMPIYCAPNTGILYKGVVRHTEGNINYLPLLDCVADMQVVLGWDLTDSSGNDGQDGVTETYSDLAGTSVSPSANQAKV